MIKYKFNKLTDNDINYRYQEKLNNKLIKKIDNETLKKIFNNISNILKITNENIIYIEYFSTNMKFN